MCRQLAVLCCGCYGFFIGLAVRVDGTEPVGYLVIYMLLYKRHHLHANFVDIYIYIRVQTAVAVTWMSLFIPVHHPRCGVALNNCALRRQVHPLIGPFYTMAHYPLCRNYLNAERSLILEWRHRKMIMHLCRCWWRLGYVEEELRVMPIVVNTTCSCFMTATWPVTYNVYVSSYIHFDVEMNNDLAWCDDNCMASWRTI